MLPRAFFWDVYNTVPTPCHIKCNRYVFCDKPRLIIDQNDADGLGNEWKFTEGMIGHDDLHSFKDSPA